MINSSSNTKHSLNKTTITASFQWSVWLGAVLTVGAIIILVKLGFWQVERGAEKQHIEAQLELRARLPVQRLSALNASPVIDSYTGIKVSASLTPVADRYLLLDNQTFDGQVGYLAYQLMQTKDGQYVLLEVGFVSALASRQVLPDVDWLVSSSHYEGRLYQRQRNPLSYQLQIEEGKVARIQNLNLTELENLWHIELLPYLFQPQQADWPYAQPWQPVPLASTRHYGYAIQWFGLAIALLCLSLWAWIQFVVRNRDD